MTPPLSASEVERLRELASKATPWTEADACTWWYPNHSGADEYRVGPPLTWECKEHVNYMGVCPPEAEATAAYIAAWNPATVLALLDALAAAEKERDRAVTKQREAEQNECTLRIERTDLGQRLKYLQDMLSYANKQRDEARAERDQWKANAIEARTQLGAVTAERDAATAALAAVEAERDALKARLAALHSGETITGREMIEWIDALEAGGRMKGENENG